MYKDVKDVTISHREIQVWGAMHRWERELKNRYPHHTRQGFDFYMNLGAYCNDFC